MKTTFLFFSLLYTSAFFAQNPPERLPEGGGEYFREKTPCLTAEDYAVIEARLAANQAQLRAAGRLPEINDRSPVIFGWPLRPGAGFPFNSYYGIENYVDQDNFPGIKDYYCGNRTYDGHKGVDISTWPFPWYLMANNFVEVVAAADGWIIDKKDGNADDHCSCAGEWNAVYVQHADGSVAWYGHLKKGSLTTKVFGSAVSKGEYLGVVGSAGCSTGPHLHLEVHQPGSGLIETFQGACNYLNTESWWQDQQEYRVPTLNAISTHSAPPVLDCPAVNEIPNFSNAFAAGSTVYFGTYYRDQLQGQVTTFKIHRPGGSIWQSWSHTAPATYSFSWWYFNWTLPAEGPYGTWTFEASYQGQTFTHPFTVGALLGSTDPAAQSPFVLSPNPTSGIVRIAGPVERIETIRIYDGLGKLVQVVSAAAGQLPIDLADLSSGVYFLEIGYDGRLARCKILKE